MLSREDKERYCDVLVALAGFGHLNKDSDEKEGVSDDSFGFHGPGVKQIQGAVQFRGE